MNFYDRQSRLHLRVPGGAIVVGCGGVGFWVATFLAMSGVEKIVLVDFDHVDETNLNRIALLPGDVNRRKVDALAEWLVALRPSINVYPVHGRVGDGITVNDLASMLNCYREDIVLFDCTDRISVQDLLHRECQGLGIKRIRAGYNGGDHITVTELPPAKWGDTEDNGYEVVPSWVVPAVLAAALAVAKEEMGIGKEASASIQQLFIQL